MPLLRTASVKYVFFSCPNFPQTFLFYFFVRFQYVLSISTKVKVGKTNTKINHFKIILTQLIVVQLFTPRFTQLQWHSNRKLWNIRWAKSKELKIIIEINFSDDKWERKTLFCFVMEVLDTTKLISIFKHIKIGNYSINFTVL